MLDKLLDEKYEKNDRSMYEKLIDKQPNAIANAKKLIRFHNKGNSSKCNPNCNPSTTVFELVEELNKFI